MDLIDSSEILFCNHGTESWALSGMCVDGFNDGCMVNINWLRIDIYLII